MMRERNAQQNFSLWTAIGILSLFAVVPFLCMLVTTFKDSAELYRKESTPFWYERAPTTEHLELLFNDTPYTTYIRNSAMVGVLVVLITLLLALPAAYALARLVGSWGERAGILVFLVYLVPQTLLFIPMFRVVVAAGLRNSVWALVMTYPTLTVPFCMWLLMGFFKSIPRELEEAALVDGYNRLNAFIRVVMPLSLPGIIAVIVFTFTLTLHEFMYALVFVTSSTERTLSVGVPVQLVRGDIFFWQSLLAAAFIVAVPVGLAYNFFLDRLVQGFTMGAVKG